MNKHYFSLEAANAMIPYLTDRIGKMQEIKQEMVALTEYLNEQGVDVKVLESKKSLPQDIEIDLTQLTLLADEINDLILEIQKQGVMLKDIDRGLVDFYAHFADQDVFLCWKLGEAEISHWHTLEEGFGGRKNLYKREFLESITTVH